MKISKKAQFRFGVFYIIVGVLFFSVDMVFFGILIGFLGITQIVGSKKDFKTTKSDSKNLKPAQPLNSKLRRMPKYSYEEVLVVGAKYLEDKSGIKEAEEYDTVYLVPEPDNPYDPDAIRVEDADERKLGYISKDSNIQSMIHDFRRRGDDVEAMIDGVSKEGVTLNIQFFRD